MYINNNNNKRYYRNRETIDTSDPCLNARSLYWSGTCTLIIIKNKRYHRNREAIDNSDTCIHDRSLYCSGTCTLIIIIIKDIIETENQLIHLTHVYMTVHSTGLVHVH